MILTTKHDNLTVEFDTFTQRYQIYDDKYNIVKETYSKESVNKFLENPQLKYIDGIIYTNEHEIEHCKITAIIEEKYLMSERCYITVNNAPKEISESLSSIYKDNEKNIEILNKITEIYKQINKLNEEKQKIESKFTPLKTLITYMEKKQNTTDNQS